MWQSLRRQWFLFSLAVVMTIGFSLPGPFIEVSASNAIRDAIVASILFAMALPLATSTIANTIRRPAAALLSSCINMGLLPLMAWGMSSGLRGDLAVGLVVTAAVPCTLASAAVWTRRAGGNDAVALMVTVLTNLTCFVLTPMWIVMATSQSTSLRLSEMVTKLALLVVLPMTIAQCLRCLPSVARLAARRKTELSAFAQVGMLCMVLIGAVTMRQSLDAISVDERPDWFEFGKVTLFVAVLHVSALAFGIFFARALNFSRADSIAIAIAGSQKTLMVGLYVTINYFGGLVLVPLVTYHVVQLLIDTVLADAWRRKQDASSSAASR